MTAQSNGTDDHEQEEEEGNSTNGGGGDSQIANNQNNENVNVAYLPNEILSIFEFLSLNKNIVFKSQQIDDPELEQNEKIRIAESLYAQNRQKFLERFGSYFQRKHLEDFGNVAIGNGAAPLNQHENLDEILDMLENFTLRLETRSKDVKNRRFAALQKLIKDGDYFSELEMMKRAPSLYQEMIGQHLTEAEKKNRDAYDVKNTTFSGILIHTMEQEKMSEILKQADEMNTKRNDDLIVDDDTTTQSSCTLGNNMESENSNPFPNFVQEEEEEEEEEEEDSHGEKKNLNLRKKVDDDFIDEIPQTCRTQWGNFDNEQKACSIRSRPESSDQMEEYKKAQERKGHSKIQKIKTITGPERDLLRREFIDIMHERFLTGEDKDFDYSGVDDNSEYDDLKQLNQDREDAYFDESDDDNDQEINSLNSPDADSEDDLDIYMRHLNNHPSLQRI